ncbi:LuxR family transcriptional regulator [Micromonospora sp. C95]|uniref:helix-turn-helix transcriptional regulator n=1 Tax=Micromonospora sp. C95 TaxID=2824882 RepID=UPI001B376CCD|nr:LuxR family transcriptional regulator [Micromonospora sp. C95]MBQ1025050.1 AAA family ATPase [Micromonospora sp. C95]
MHLLVGRERKYSTLVGHVDAVLQGAGGCIILEGPIGIGKTRLLRAASLAGAEQGVTVNYVRVGSADRPTPVRELVNFLRHLISSGFEFDELVRPDVNPFLLADRLAELFDKAACRRPLLVILDDIHQADEVSALALQNLVQSLASSPVLWLLARRPIPAHSLAQQAIGWLIDRSAVSLRLGPLDEGAVAKLCADTLGAEPDDSVLAWAARCNGNPRLLQMLLEALVEAGEIVVVDGRACTSADRLPEGVGPALDRLLGELPDRVRRLLIKGRSIGRTFSVAEVAPLLGDPGLDLSAAAHEAVQGGLLTRSGATMAFAHDLVAEGLEHSASRTVDDGPPVAKAAVRLRRPARSRARNFHSEGQAAQRPLPSTAPAQSSGCGCAEILTRVMRTLVGQFEQLPQSLARACNLLAGAGRAVEAGRLAEPIVQAGIPPATQVQLTLDLAARMTAAGQVGMPVEWLQRTLARRDLDECHRVAVKQALADLTSGSTYRPPPDVLLPGGGRWAAAASSYRDGGEVPATDRTARAGGWQPTAARAGDTGSGAYGLRSGGNRSCVTCEPPLWTWLIRALVATDQMHEASAACAAIRQEAERAGRAWSEPRWHGHQAELLVTAGQLNEARLAAEAGLRVLDRSGPEDSVLARAVLTRISLHLGEPDTASEHLRKAERLLHHDAAIDRLGFNWALAQFHAASGRPNQGVQTLLSGGSAGAPDRFLFAEAPTAAALAVRMARKAGLAAEAERAVEIVRSLADQNPDAESLAAGADHAEGLLRGDFAAMHRAVEHYRRSGRRLAAGVALEDTAKEEQIARNQPEAARLLESAFDLYEQCGARRDASRVQAKLRHLGVPAGTPGADRPTSGWESLTTAELRVVRAIVDGRTNREAATMLFLSPHTVDSHLRRVFAKLGIRTRVELTKHFISHESS